MLEFKENQWGTGYTVLKDGERVASVIPQGDKVGYTVFNTPDMGTKGSIEDVKSHLEKVLG